MNSVWESQEEKTENERMREWLEQLRKWKNTMSSEAREETSDLNTQEYCGLNVPSKTHVEI